MRRGQLCFFFFLPSDPDWGREGKDFQGGVVGVVFRMLFPVYFIFHLQTRWQRVSAGELRGVGVVDGVWELGGGVRER
jgi:hypothetical protein